MNAGQMMARRWREATLILVCFVMLAGLWARGPIRQDTVYHNFADQRELLGVPHLFDVASNMAFLMIGIAGILLCGRRRPPIAASWWALFVGTALVFFGSSYYHWQPSNESLIWDRLPMTVGFMGLFVALLAEHIDARLERMLLVPALALGVASALWWHFTDDLRFYFWVQFTPLVCIPLVLAMYRGAYTHRIYLLYGLGFYVCAKLAEIWDHQIFALTSNAVSGHTLKHLFAAAAVFAILLMLGRRERLPLGCLARGAV